MRIPAQEVYILTETNTPLKAGCITVPCSTGRLHTFHFISVFHFAVLLQIEESCLTVSYFTNPLFIMVFFYLEVFSVLVKCFISMFIK